MKKDKLKGIGGWLILPIIGLSLTVVISLLSLMDSLLFYYFDDVFLAILVDSLNLVLSGLTLFFIFTKQKLGKTFAQITYGFFAFTSLILLDVVGAIAGIVWILYFIKSERVKNTLVN